MSAPAPSPNSDVPEADRRLAVLVADDYPENRRLLYFYLRDRFEVLQAATAEEALTLLRERHAAGEPVAIAVLDLNFCDGMSGIDAIQAIRKDPALAGVRAVALTAYAFPDDRQRCLDAGFDAYIPKPVFKPGLLEKLDSLLGAPPSGDGGTSELGNVWVSRPGGGA